MNRYTGWSLALAVGAAMAAAVFACSSDESRGRTCIGCEDGGNGGPGAGGSGGGSGPSGAVCGGDTGVECACDGECCPPAGSTCYGPDVPDGYGDECFAQRHQAVGSANEDRLQYKLTWARSTTPPGNANAQVYSVLSQGANLVWPSECNQSGLGIFIQLLDLDLTAEDEADHRVRSGWAPNQQNADALQVREDGLCMVEDTYDAPEYNLPADQMTSTDGWPEGLPAPMARGPRGQPAQNPWQVKPAVLARRPTSEGDFNVSSDRQALIDAANDLGVDGITYIDQATGYSHSYVKQTWVVVTLGTPIAIPIREVETTYQLNDPAERACMGAYRFHELTPASDCLSPTEQLNPEWGYFKDIGGDPGFGPAVAEGYFLITELEQVFSQTLGNTLCVTYPGELSPMVPKVEDEGFYEPSLGSCVTVNWDPANGGIPRGNWCAATNSEDTDDCHDAWRSVTYQTFQSFPVQQATCAGLAPPAM